MSERSRTVALRDRTIARWFCDFVALSSISVNSFESRIFLRKMNFNGIILKFFFRSLLQKQLFLTAKTGFFWAVSGAANDLRSVKIINFC